MEDRIADYAKINAKKKVRGEKEMTFEEFNEYQNNLLEQVVQMKNTKGKEYANSTSRFANFDRLANRLKQPRLVIALIYFTKHMDAIESYISNSRIYSEETIQGRILDAITYLTLIGGMIQEDESKIDVNKTT